jgi:hypothetical protein
MWQLLNFMAVRPQVDTSIIKTYYLPAASDVSSLGPHRREGSNKPLKIILSGYTV